MRLSALLVVASLAVAGCGGGGSSSGASMLPSNSNGAHTSPATLPASYTLVDLGANVQPARLSASGQVVGSVLQSGHQVAFLYNHGAVTRLGTLAGDTDSAAADINDGGQIVGDSWHMTVTSGFTFQASRAVSFVPGSTPVFLGTFEGSASAATAINNAGQIAGDGIFPGFCVGFVLLFDGHGGVTAPLGTGVSGVPSAINSAGTIAFADFTTGAGGCGGYFSPTTFPPLTTIPLPNETGGRNNNTVGDINDAGHVVGSYDAGIPPVAGTAGFFYHDGTTQEIDGPGGPQNVVLIPLGLNNIDHIVGEFGNGPIPSASGFSAFIWINGTLTDLNTRLPASCAGWKLQSATDVNDSGEIVGTGTLGGTPHGFLLIPHS